MNLIDLQVLAQKIKCPYYIAIGKGGEGMEVRLPRGRVGRQRSGGAVTSAEYVSADDEVMARIIHAPFREEVLPPGCEIGTPSQGMTNPNHVVARRTNLAQR